jgi:hypothetical protein
MGVDGGGGATVVNSAVVGIVVVGVEMAVLDDEAAEVTEVDVVLGVPLDEPTNPAGFTWCGASGVERCGCPGFTPSGSQG